MSREFPRPRLPFELEDSEGEEDSEEDEAEDEEESEDRGVSE